MGKTTIKGINGFEFDKEGTCKNPEQLLHFESEDFSYTLMIAECNMGYLTGYLFDDSTRKETVENVVKSSNEIFTKRELAMQAVGEQAWAFFGTSIRPGKGKPIKSEFDALHQYLVDVRSPLVAIIKKGKDDSNKKPNPLTAVPPTPPPADDQHQEDAVEQLPDGAIEITAASINDDFCNYSYKINPGKKQEFKHNVTNTTAIIDDDMKTAFSKLAIHLAIKDDIFKHSGTEIENIDTMHTHELTTLYQVTGFKMKGGPSDPAVVLIGNKYLSGGDRMELDSPKISIDNLSSYKWWSELAAAVEQCQQEVLLYHQGKFTVKEKVVEEKPNKKQGSLFPKPGDEGHRDDDEDQNEQF